MKRIEVQRESLRRIKKMNGTLRNAKGLTKVVIPRENGSDLELVEKLDMEKALLEAYEMTLTQSNRTPCMQFSLLERIELNATKETAQKIIEGSEYNDEGIDNATKEVLKYLALKEGSNRYFAPKSLNVEECQEGWRKVSERTSSSMRNGTHFGH